MKQLESHTGAPFLNTKDLVITKEFLATFELTHYFNKILERATIQGLPRNGKDTLAIALNSCMCAEDRLASLAASAQNEQYQSCGLPRLYTKAAVYFTKKYATG